MKKLCVALILIFAGPAAAEQNISMMVFFAVEKAINPSAPVHLCCSRKELSSGHTKSEMGKHMTLGCHALQVDPSGSTFIAKYDPSCTAAQVSTGNAAISSFKPNK
jgi:hypothetical protein